MAPPGWLPTFAAGLAPWVALRPPGAAHRAMCAIQVSCGGPPSALVAPMLPRCPPPLHQAPKPFAAAQRLASSANGIAAAPRPVLAARSKQQQQAAAAPALEVVAADGPRGMKLKSRKASRLWLLLMLKPCSSFVTCGRRREVHAPAARHLLHCAPAARLPHGACCVPNLQVVAPSAQSAVKQSNITGSSTSQGSGPSFVRCKTNSAGRSSFIHVPQSAAKRYKITGSGKVMVRRAGKQHLNEKQSRKTKRNLG